MLVIKSFDDQNYTSPQRGAQIYPHAARRSNGSSGTRDKGLSSDGFAGYDKSCIIYVVDQASECVDEKLKVNLVQLLNFQGDIMEWQDLTMAQKKYLIQDCIRVTLLIIIHLHKHDRDTIPL